MRKTQIPLLILVVLVSALFVFAQKAKVKKTTIASKTKVSTEVQSGLLYEIRGKNLQKPSYIFGTIHIICPNDVFGMEKLSGYFNQTERLFLELDLDDPAVTSKMTTTMDMPDGKTLRDYLTPEKYEKVDAMFKDVFGVSVSLLGKFSPTGLAIAITTGPKATGCAVPTAYESKFVALATQAKKPVEGLETVEDEMAALNKTPIEKQAETLYKMSLNVPETLAQYKKLLALYKEQDTEKLEKFIQENGEDNSDSNKNLLDERNKKWLPEIEKAISEKASFIAVGSGHLGGKNGIINLLRQKGYTLTPIKL